MTSNNPTSKELRERRYAHLPSEEAEEATTEAVDEKAIEEIAEEVKEESSESPKAQDEISS